MSNNLVSTSVDSKDNVVDVKKEPDAPEDKERIAVYIGEWTRARPLILEEQDEEGFNILSYDPYCVTGGFKRVFCVGRVSAHRLVAWAVRKGLPVRGGSLRIVLEIPVYMKNDYLGEPKSLSLIWKSMVKRNGLNGRGFHHLNENGEHVCDALVLRDLQAKAESTKTDENGNTVLTLKALIGRVEIKYVTEEARKYLEKYDRIWAGVSFTAEEGETEEEKKPN